MEKIQSLEQFNQILANHEYVVAYFSRLWCGVCHAMQPRVDELLNHYPSIKSVEVNIDEVAEIGGQNTIFSVPAIILFVSGKEFTRQAGYLKLDQLENLLDRIEMMDS